MKSILFALLALLDLHARADIYDPPVETAPGGVRGTVTSPITGAVLVGANVLSVYKGSVSPDKRSFEFKGVPIGKYDILLFDEPENKNRRGTLYSGLAIAEGTAEVPPKFADALMKRMQLNDRFFTRFQIAGFSFVEGTSIALAAVERIKESPITHMNGTVQTHYLRRVEIATAELAVDDWKTNATRHVYRVEMPMETGWPFLNYVRVPALGKIRIVDTVKDLGEIGLPFPKTGGNGTKE